MKHRMRSELCFLASVWGAIFPSEDRVSRETLVRNGDIFQNDHGMDEFLTELTQKCGKTLDMGILL